MGSARSFLPLLIFSFLVGLAGCRGSRAPASAAAPSVGSEAPELTMEPVRIQSYSADGLEWELEAPRAQGYTTKNIMHINQLSVSLFDKGQKSSDIKADEGLIHTSQQSSPTSETVSSRTITLDSGDMYLYGNVVVVSTDGARVDTDWLLYRKSTDLITSTAPVKITRDNSVTTGVGMEAKPDLSVLNIFNQTLVIKE